MAMFKDIYYELDDMMKTWAAESGLEVKVVELLHKADDIARQARELLGDHPGERIYLLKKLESAPVEPTLNRIGGRPPGISDSGWPRWDDEPMEHLYTIDLDTMPELRSLSGLAEARAAVLFINNANHNEAWEPNNDQTCLIAVTQAEVDAGAVETPLAGNNDETHFVAVPVEVPPEIWGDDIDSDSELGMLRGAIYTYYARARGEPIWLQDEEHCGGYVMQLDEVLWTSTWAMRV